MSQATLAFNKGLGFFYTGYYTKALKRFAGVKKINNEYPMLNYYIESATNKITMGQDKDTVRRRFIFRVMAFLFIIGGLFIFYRWQRNKQASINNLN
jgi:hypothetical protein